MSRLEAKCFITSAVLHGLLATVFLAGSAFMASKAPDNDLPILNVIPARLVDEAISGGGAPGPPPLQVVAPGPAPVVPVAPPPAPRPVVPAPPAAPPVAPPVRPPSAAPPRVTEPDEVPENPSLTEKSTAPRHQIVINKKPVVLGSEPATAAANARAQRIAQAQEEARAYALAEGARRQQVNGIVKTLSTGLSGSVSIESIGGAGEGGTGGEAYANYAQAIKSLYDKQWRDPADVIDDALTVRTQIVIARDGTIVLARIVKLSGNVALDRSVKSALEGVQRAPPFPEGATDRERTYFINFNLKSRRSAG